MADETNTKTKTPARDRYEEAAHVLPRWVNFIIENWLLTFLLLAEAYLLGTLMTLGWVKDIESPGQWGWYHAIGVALFFAAGATAAGVALRCSVASVGAFKRHEWGFALFNLLGLLVFSGVEIWASLSERSANLRPTPADVAVLDALHLHGAPISPTVVMVAVLLPFASIYYGFSQQGRVHETEADLAEKKRKLAAQLDEKRMRAEANATIRATQVQGLRQMAQALRQGGQADQTTATEDLPQLPLAGNGHAPRSS
jgi:hypothetical protein